MSENNKGDAKNGKNAFLHELGRRVLVFDGATGTVLQSWGLAPGELSDSWNTEHPELIYRLHREYLDAGADLIKTNTFVTSRLKHENAAEIARAAAVTARRAVTDAGRGYVALDLGPTGVLMEPLGGMTFDRARELYAEVIGAAAEFCDCVLFETFSDVYEAKAAVTAAIESCGLPVLTSFTVDERGRLLSGADIETAAVVMESMGASAIGLNCGVGPDAMEKTMAELLSKTSLPVIVSPNAGLPTVDENGLHYHISPAEYAAAEARMARLGAAAVGGCCGTSPEYIAAVSRIVSGLDVLSRDVKKRTRAASATRTIEIGARPVVIGERINPTGKPKLKAALARGDTDYILSLAYSQFEAGADAVDVNCGVPETDERAVLTDVVRKVQGAIPLPLVIDTSDPDAMESAMRACAGKPIVNSVNGKRETLDKILPLVKKYGGVVIGLTLDENGIPSDPDGRVRIARRILEAAEAYGIDKSDVLIDALTLTVAADKSAAETTLKAVKMIRDELGVGVVLGVSNVSFGLPARETVNAAFLTLALEAGLSAAIMNPELQSMRGAIAAFSALHGDFDALGDSAGGKTAADGGGASDVPPSLAEFVFRGRRADAAAATRALLADGVPPMKIIDGYIIPGLSRLGAEYEANRIFLPQLMAGADAASSSFAELKGALSSVGEGEGRGVIVMATVEGDVHDIGKNICTAILSNYGYDVHDLGRDVKPSRIVEEVMSTGARLVGLSALMTTTVPAMKRTIEALRAAGADCKVVVGGAVLTSELAEQIGADYYSPDAMANVRIAEEVYGK